MNYQIRDVSESLEVLSIGPDWLTQALCQTYPGIEISHAEIVEIIQGASVKIRVALTYNDDKCDAYLPANIVIKGCFGRQDPSWYNAVMANEMRSYRDIVRLSGVTAPKSYFTGYYPEADHAIIIMEDLSENKVFFGGAHCTYSFDQAAASLSNLAKLHAFWWGDPKIVSPPFSEWLQTIHTGLIGQRHKSLLRADDWHYYCSLPRGLGLPKVFKDAERMMKALEKLHAVYDKMPHTIVHGDYHIGNTYIDAKGAGGAYDWICSRGVWPHDVSYFMVNALDVDDRRTWEQALLHHYLTQLELNGVSAPSFDEAWWHYRANTLPSLITWVGNGDDQGQFQPENINTAGAVRAAWAASDLGTLDLLT